MSEKSNTPILNHLFNGVTIRDKDISNNIFIPYKTNLYQIDNTLLSNYPLLVVKIMEKDTQQILNISFTAFSNAEQGLLAIEYLPQYVNPKDNKKVDFTYIHINQESKNIKIYLYDIKQSLGAKEATIHFVEQMRDGYRYCDSLMLNIDAKKKHFDIEYEVGAILEKLNVKQLNLCISKLEEELNPNSKTPSLLHLKTNFINRIQTENTLKTLKNFQNGFIIVNNNNDEDKVYKLNFRFIEDNINKTYNMCFKGAKN